MALTLTRRADTPWSRLIESYASVWILEVAMGNGVRLCSTKMVVVFLAERSFLTRAALSF